MVATLEITVRDEQRRLRRDFLLYEPFMMDEQDEVVAKCIKETVDEFKGEPDDIKLKATMVLQ